MVVEFPDLGKVEEDIIPDIDNLRNLGSANRRWAQLFIAALVISTLTIGSIVLTDDEGFLLINASTFINGTLNVSEEIFEDGVEVATLDDLTGGNVTVTSIIRVQNKIGNSIPPLTLLFFSGYNVGQNAPEAQYAINTDSDKHAECITSETIANNGFGSCVIIGLINDVDTSSTTALAELHLNTTKGTFIEEEPTKVECLPLFLFPFHTVHLFLQLYCSS